MAVERVKPGCCVSQELAWPSAGRAITLSRELVGCQGRVLQCKVTASEAGPHGQAGHSLRQWRWLLWDGKMDKHRRVVLTEHLQQVQEFRGLEELNKG